MSTITGTISAVLGEVVEIEFLGEKPKLNTIVFLEEDKEVKLEIFLSSRGNSFYCLPLTSKDKLRRGLRVVASEEPILFPVGEALLGRVVDLFGKPMDGKGEIRQSSFAPIMGQEIPSLKKIVYSSEILETGIKVIDFFHPLTKGGKVGIIGGGGVGKTILLTEIMHNVLIKENQGLAVFAGIGERIREGHELVELLETNKVLSKVGIILGTMGQPPTIRFRSALSALTLVEYLRDQRKSNILFFVDNLYRLAQAGYEVSTLMNLIPSEGGYQSTLEEQMAEFHERLVSTSNGFLTSIETVFVPSDDLTDVGVQSAFPYLDSVIVLSRSLYQQGRLPAIDILSSSSISVAPEILGKRHYQDLIEAQRVLKRAASLERIVSLVGESELSATDRLTYKRAKLLESYFTQPLFSVQEQTGRKGEFVPLQQVIVDVEVILNGGLDDIVEPEKIMFLGSLREVKEIKSL